MEIIESHPGMIMNQRDASRCIQNGMTKNQRDAS